VVSRRSLGYALLAGVVTLLVAMPLWGILNESAGMIFDQPTWANTSQGYNHTDAASKAAQGQGAVAAIWRYVPVEMAIAVAFAVLVRSRGGR
jgi:hypothetical protein